MTNKQLAHRFRLGDFEGEPGVGIQSHAKPQPSLPLAPPRKNLRTQNISAVPVKRVAVHAALSLLRPCRQGWRGGTKCFLKRHCRWRCCWLLAYNAQQWHPARSLQLQHTRMMGLWTCSLLVLGGAGCWR